VRAFELERIRNKDEATDKPFVPEL
jgi:hypothetical protein